MLLDEARKIFGESFLAAAILERRFFLIVESGVSRRMSMPPISMKTASNFLVCPDETVPMTVGRSPRERAMIPRLRILCSGKAAAIFPARDRVGSEAPTP